jgi:predicted RNase H-like nuclease
MQTHQRTPKNSSGPFLGVDGSRGRWVAVALGKDGHFQSALLADSLREIVASYRTAAVIAIDVPIGLPESGQRQADLEAKMLLGPRRSTIFAVPPRPVLAATTYAAARERALELTGKSISAQSFALRHNILEAEHLALDDRVHEVHPELAFRALSGRVLLSNKRTWRGAVERQEALAKVEITLPSHLGSAGDAPIDDVLDAAVCAWVATRIASGSASSVPAEPELDPTGRPMAIWF